MSRFFVADPLTPVIEGEEYKHLASVLRLQKGDTVTLCDGNGRECEARITALTGRQALLAPEAWEPCRSEPAHQVTLFQCLPKTGKMELILQKCTELGLYALVPVVSRRCVALPGKDFEKKRQRYEKVAEAAAKQSGRGILPRVESPVELETLDFSDFDLVLLAYEGEHIRTLKQALTPAPGPRIDTYTADDNGGICRREIGPEDTIDGIKAKDWAAYVGRSPMYYLMQFFRMSITKQKVTVCLSAFLFGPAYLLYRKMWKEGLLTALLSIALSVPSLIAIVATFNPSLFGSMPLHWVPVAADVCAIADWIVRILLGLFSVWLYRNTSKKNIDKIYSEYPEGDARTDALLQKGGTSIWAALLYFGIVLLLSSLVINLAGPGFVQYAMAMAGY